MIPQPAWKWLAGIGLCLGLVLLLAGASMFYPSPRVEAPAGYQLETYPVRRIEADLTHAQRCPNLKAKEWIIFVAQPPELPGQSKLSLRTEPAGQPLTESSPLHRALLMLRLPGGTANPQQFEVKVKYQATLHARKLTALPAGQQPRATASLSAAERKLFLAPHGQCDFQVPEFQRWLDKLKLRRGLAEPDVDFARRVFLAITQGWKYDYRPGQERQVSKLPALQATDCGGMCLLFTAALRANDIPARVLAGRWADSSKPGENLGGAAYHQAHVKAEFHAQGVGWVPVDPASAVLHDRSKAGLRYFGNDAGDFLTMHLDTDLQVDSIHFGKKTLPWLQGITYWVAGIGNPDQAIVTERWEVRKLDP